mgnify:CR=1 FL=1
MSSEVSTDTRDTREHVLAVATTLFAEKGFDSVSVREICEAAGVSKPVVYYHFDSRDGLVLAVLQRFGERFAHIARSHLEGVEPGHGPLIAFFAAMIDLGRGDPTVGRVMARIPTLNAGLRDRLPPPAHRERWLTTFIEAGIDNGAFASDTDAEAATWLLVGGFGRMAAAEICCDPGGAPLDVASRMVHQALPATPGAARQDLHDVPHDIQSAPPDLQGEPGRSGKERG